MITNGPEIPWLWSFPGLIWHQLQGWNYSWCLTLVQENRIHQTIETDYSGDFSLHSSCLQGLSDTSQTDPVAKAHSFPRHWHHEDLSEYGQHWSRGFGHCESIVIKITSHFPHLPKTDPWPSLSFPSLLVCFWARWRSKPKC